MVRPVSDEYPISQLFAGLATAGVVGRPDGSEVEYLVWLYGDYQHYGHAGVDIACPVGTPVRAMRSGTVVYAGWGEDLPGDDSWGPSGYFRRWGMYKNFPGIVTVIKADGVNEFDIYGHQFSNDEVSIGLRVADGQVIGKSGDTKTRTEKVGPHLHVVTVADPVNYSTDWPRIIFGCIDPTPLFGSQGIVLQGAITNAAATQAQEEDVTTPEQIDKIVTATNEGTQAIANQVFERLLKELPPGVWGYRNGEERDAYQILRDNPKDGWKVQLDYRDPATGELSGQKTTAETVLSFADRNLVLVLDSITASARGIVDAVKAAPDADAAQVAESAFQAFEAKLSTIKLTISTAGDN